MAKSAWKACLHSPRLFLLLSIANISFLQPVQSILANIPNEGRINFIEWGLSNNSSTLHALIISNWSSDAPTTAPITLGTASYTPCDPVILPRNDYIIAYTGYYDYSYIYGYELYTLAGRTFACFDAETVSDKISITIPQNTYYKNNSDFYYLSGWTAYHDVLIDHEIQLHFSNIAWVHALVEHLPDSSFSASSQYYSATTGWWYAHNARYSMDGWSAAGNVTGEWLQIDLLRPVSVEYIRSTGIYEELVTEYELSWSLNSSHWESIILASNETVALHSFADDPIFAQYVRFTVLEFEEWPTLRLEIYGHDYVTTEYQDIDRDTITRPTTTITDEYDLVSTQYKAITTTQSETPSISTSTSTPVGQYVIIIVIIVCTFFVLFVAWKYVQHKKLKQRVKETQGEPVPLTPLTPLRPPNAPQSVVAAADKFQLQPGAKGMDAAEQNTDDDDDSKDDDDVERSWRADAVEHDIEYERKVNEVRVWLTNTVGLPQYVESFIDHGFDDMEVIKTMSDQELYTIGVQKLGHQKKISQYIRNLWAVQQQREADSQCDSIISSSEEGDDSIYEPYEHPPTEGNNVNEWTTGMDEAQEEAPQAFTS